MTQLTTLSFRTYSLPLAVGPFPFWAFLLGPLLPLLTSWAVQLFFPFSVGAPRRSVLGPLHCSTITWLATSSVIQSQSFKYHLYVDSSQSFPPAQPSLPVPRLLYPTVSSAFPPGSCFDGSNFIRPQQNSCSSASNVASPSHHPHPPSDCSGPQPRNDPRILPFSRVPHPI